MKHKYRFNRPVSLLFLLPMLILLGMLVAGLVREFSALPLLLALFTFAVLCSVIFFGVLRSLEVGPEELVWRAPGKVRRFKVDEIKHYGIVKYRSFRFIYLSRMETPPFEKADTRIVSTDDTFVIQYRAGAWKHVSELIQINNSSLKAESIVRG